MQVFTESTSDLRQAASIQTAFAPIHTVEFLAPTHHRLITFPFNWSRFHQPVAFEPVQSALSATRWSNRIEMSEIGDIINDEQVIIADLQKVGINLHIQDDSIAAWGALETGVASKRVAAFAVSGCQSPDPSEYTYVLGSWNTKPGEWNFADYGPPALDSLINAGIATSVPVQRFAKYSAILQNLQDNVPYVGLFDADDVIALSSKFVIPGYNSYSFDSAYPLLIKPAS